MCFARLAHKMPVRVRFCGAEPLRHNYARHIIRTAHLRTASRQRKRLRVR